jgi:hypothetical protein
MKAELKKIGDVTSRGVILLPLNPDYVFETNVAPGDDIYIGYGKSFIVISKDIDTINMMAEKNQALIIDKAKRRKGLHI